MLIPFRPEPNATRGPFENPQDHAGMQTLSDHLTVYQRGFVFDMDNAYRSIGINSG